MNRLACIAMLALLSPIAAMAGDAIQLLPAIGAPEKDAPPYHGADVTDIANGQEWFAIIRSGEQFAAKKISLLVRTAKDDVLDADGAPPTGKTIATLPYYTDSLFLVRGLSLADNQSIPAAKIDGKPFNNDIGFDLNAGKTLALTLDDHRYELTATAEASQVNNADALHNYQLTLTADDTAQPLLTLPALDDATPQLLWAGDLNDDGYADFLINTTDHYNVYQPTLFLSKVEGGTVAYIKAAERKLMGC